MMQLFPYLTFFVFIVSTSDLFGNSKLYKFDFDFDGQEDELLIHFDNKNQVYDYIEFYLSAQGYFKYRSDNGYDYMPNDAGILFNNDGWDSKTWDLFYWIEKSERINYFIFNTKTSKADDLNRHLVVRITGKSISTCFEVPFKISKVLPQGSSINLFGFNRYSQSLPDTVIDGRTYRVRSYVPYLCYSLDSVETFDLEKSISYNQKYNQGWARSRRRKVITDKLTKHEYFLFETYRKFPESSLRYLSRSDLSIYSKDELRLMRNEIFADYGYVFDDEVLRWEFEKLGWYHSEDKDVNNDLSEIEISNIRLISEIESSLK